MTGTRANRRTPLLMTLSLLLAVTCAGCKKRCPEGQKVLVWTVNGVTNTQCVNR